MNRKKSEAFLHRMSHLVPGGASSNARCGSPIAVQRAKGAELIDLDGNSYIDYVLGFGPILLGHAHPSVAQAVSEAMREGTTYAFSHEGEYRVIEQIVSLCPSVEMVRLCNSGTDAVTTAYRIACTHTGATMAVKIEGDYHGNLDVLLHDIPGVESSMLDGKPVSASTGLSKQAGTLVRTVPFNDADALGNVLSQHSGKVAAVILEPILGNTATIMPTTGYLASVRSLCDEHGVVLILDEVKTGFRAGLGGAQAALDIEGDLIAYGKAIGNGLPIAALGGKRHLMELVFPGGVHHCGTYFGNVPCTAAAEAVLSFLRSSDYAPILRRGEWLARGICDLLASADIPAHWHGIGTMFGITIGEQSPNDYRSWWENSDRQVWNDIASELRDLGILVDGFIGVFFLSFAHTDEHITQTLSLCEEAIRRYRQKRSI